MYNNSVVIHIMQSQSVGFLQMALKLMAMLAIVFLVFLDRIIFIAIFTH